MVSGERCIKKTSQNPNLKMVSGEGYIKKKLAKTKPKNGQWRTIY
jgi:hypothetical protein